MPPLWSLGSLGAEEDILPNLGHPRGHPLHGLAVGRSDVQVVHSVGESQLYRFVGDLPAYVFYACAAEGNDGAMVTCPTESALFHR